MQYCGFDIHGVGGEDVRGPGRVEILAVAEIIAVEFDQVM